ncbi:hypothetical protein D9M68_58350 [compost metagenome]
MTIRNGLFSSESVSAGHPDKRSPTVFPTVSSMPSWRAIPIRASLARLCWLTSA